jgi:hypothetical protein
MKAVGPLFEPPLTFKLLPVDVEATYPLVGTAATSPAAMQSYHL